MDLSGKGRHGRIASVDNRRPHLVGAYMQEVPSVFRKYLNLNWDFTHTLSLGYLDVTDTDYDFSDLTVSSSSKMTVMVVADKTTNSHQPLLYWKPTSPTNNVSNLNSFVTARSIFLFRVQFCLKVKQRVCYIIQMVAHTEMCVLVTPIL